jgi:hypothetical protein
MPVPTTFGVSSKSYLDACRELVTGTPNVTTPLFTLPMDKGDYSPEDTPKFLPDESIRGVMAMLYNDIIGVEDATFSFGAPVFTDDIGIWIDNTFGDLSTVSNGTLGSAVALGSAISAGATQLSPGSTLGTAVTTGSIIQITDGAASEVILCTSGSSGTNVLFANTPTRFAHTTSATVALQTAASNYTHTWSILNSGTGQPPTHTLYDYSGLTSGGQARAYPSACASGLDFSGNTEQLLTYKVQGNSWLSTTAAAPTLATAFVKPQAAWESTVSVGGSQIYSIGSWTWQAKRTLQVYWTAQNSQTPYIIARGGLGVTLGLNYTVPTDETALTNMLTAGPLAVSIVTSNGLSGANLQSLTLQTTTAQFVKSKISRSNVLVGYDDSAEAVANTTDAGGSGGIAPAKVILTNATPCY